MSGTFAWEHKKLELNRIALQLSVYHTRTLFLLQLKISYTHFHGMNLMCRVKESRAGPHVTTTPALSYPHPNCVIGCCCRQASGVSPSHCVHPTKPPLRLQCSTGSITPRSSSFSLVTMKPTWVVTFQDYLLSLCAHNKITFEGVLC